MKKSIIIPALILFLASCQEKTETKHTEKKDSLKITEDLVQLTPAQIQNAGITLGSPEQKEMKNTVRVSGTLDVPPENIVSISIPMGGYVKKMAIIPGQKIPKGGILAVLEDQQYIQLQQDYLTARSRLTYLEADYNRQKGLNATKAASDKIFQQAQAEFESEKVLLKGLSEKLLLIGIDPQTLNEGNISRSIAIHAPISGFVTKVNINMGKYVSPTDVLFELTDPADLHLRLTVFENIATHLKKEQKLLCWTNEQPDTKYAATIHFITPNISEDRTTDVHCHLDRVSANLFPGMFMNAAIQLDNAKAQALPDDAVVKWENKYYVFAQETAGTFRMTPVQTGISNGGYTEIRSELPARQIVTANAYTLLMKMKNSGED